MAVRPYVGAGLQHVEKALHQIGALMQVVVQAFARSLQSLAGHRIKQRLIDALQSGLFSISHRWMSRCGRRPAPARGTATTSRG